MKRLVLIAALLLPGAASAQFFFGRGPDETVAVVWIPQVDRLNWEEVLDHLESVEEFRLTIALPPSAIPLDEIDRIKAMIARRKLQLVMRIPGDPVLPLLRNIRSPWIWKGGQPAVDFELQRDLDASALIARPRERFRRRFGEFPKGLIPTGGLSTADLFANYRAQGVEWVASGLYDPETPAPQREWYDAGGVLFVPFQAVFSGAADLDPRKTQAWVLDETDPRLTEGGFEQVRALHKRNKHFDWLVVEDVISVHLPRRKLKSGDAAVLVGWVPGYKAWIGSPDQNLAWRILSMAAEAYDTYLNSGRADVWTLDKLEETLYKLEHGGPFRLFGLDDAAAPDNPFLQTQNEAVEEDPATASEREAKAAAWKGFKDDVRRMFSLLRQRQPTALRHLLAGGSAALADEEESPPTVDSGENWINFLNTGKTNLNPEPLPDLPKDLEPRRKRDPVPVWHLEQLRVEWTADSIILETRPEKLVVEDGAFRHVMIDLYIDLNNRVGSGASKLLPGRDAYMEAADAWEYAVAIRPGAARLFKANPDGSRRLIDDMTPTLKNGAVRVVLPRAHLRGNPMRWGYLAAAMAPADDSDAPAPVKSARGHALLDILTDNSGKAPKARLRQRIFRALRP